MSQHTLIKMCGMTREEDIRDSVNAGTHAIGLNFYPPSPRFVELDRARTLASAIPADILTIPLFVNADASFVREVVAEIRADMIQFHGDESPEYCQQFGLPYIKALRVKSQEALLQHWNMHLEADFMLLDAFVPGVPGGTGERFDWDLISRDMTDRLFLAGGLTPESVFTAVQQVRPYAVDVAGGIELRKGIKSSAKMKAFADEVRRADASFNEKSS